MTRRCRARGLEEMEKLSSASDDETEIRAAIGRFVAAYNRNDRVGIRTFFASDFVDMSAGEPTRRGEDAVKFMLERVAFAHSNSTPKLEINVHEIHVYGDWAHQRGDLQVTLTPKNGGESSYIRQRFLEIWRRGPTGWKSVVGMDNE
jgi:ketosteroid isomerase-like protein